MKQFLSTQWGAKWGPLGNQNEKHRSEGKLKEVLVEGLYRKLSEETDQISEAFRFDDFEIRDGNCTAETRAHP